MTSDQTRVSLLVRVRNPANQQAWSEFEARYRDLVQRYCRRRGLQDADSEDVYQNVLASLAQSLRQFEYNPERGTFRSYLYRVVRNAISRHAQSRPRAAALDPTLAANLADDRPEADPQWEQEWVSHHYRLGLRTLRATVDTRSVEIFEALLAGRSTEEVAAAFDSTAEAVHKVRQRMRARLTERIAEQVREEDEPDAFAALESEPTGKNQP